MIEENFKTILSKIKQSCNLCNRNPNEIKVIAVTKTFPQNAIETIANLNVFDIGENFVQEILEKKKEIKNENINWHFIGHLQKNKIKYIAQFVHLIHSVDSFELAYEIDKKGLQHNRKIDILIEVNTTNEISKFGVNSNNVFQFAEKILTLQNINLKGLMTLGPNTDNEIQIRNSFLTLRNCRDKLINLDKNIIELSMGMSNDFEIAIQEGATMLRLGTAIFGKRNKKL